MDINNFISSNVYIVSIALFILGLIFKNTPKIPNWSIPYILCILGIIACNIILGPSFNSTLQGILTTGMAVYIHQLGKQGLEFVSSQNNNDKSNK